jgi:hypothetical protein
MSGRAVETDLVRLINRGRCFALVGSGPSCEMGYPSWESLARQVYESVQRTCSGCDCTSYDSFLTRKDYPAVFRQAEVDMGARERLVEWTAPDLLDTSLGGIC